MMNCLLITDTLFNDQIIDILIVENKIEKIGKNLTTESPANIRVIKGKGTAVLPSLFNAHTHSPMVLLRGYGDDMELDQWLKTRIWPAENKMSDEEYYWGYKLAFIEMIKSGTTFFNEMYLRPHIALEALKELPLKGLINFPIFDGMDESIGRIQVKECEQFFNRTVVPEGVTLGMAAHSVYMDSRFSLEWIRDFATANHLKVHIHLCETGKEVADCKSANNGLNPLEYLDSLDFLNDRILAAHSVWLSEKDMELYAEKGITAIHNPVSNMKLAIGKAFPYAELKKRSVPMLLGTDSAASNNNLDLIEEMKMAALLQKHHYQNPSLLSAEEIFAIATKQSAEIFETNGGEVKEGAEADLILVNIETPEMVPLTNLISNLVYSASGHVVETVICGGKVLMENRFIDAEDEIRSKAAECAARLTGKSHQ